MKMNLKLLTAVIWLACLGCEPATRPEANPASGPTPVQTQESDESLGETGEKLRSAVVEAGQIAAREVKKAADVAGEAIADAAPVVEERAREAGERLKQFAEDVTKPDASHATSTPTPDLPVSPIASPTPVPPQTP